MTSLSNRFQLLLLAVVVFCAAACNDDEGPTITPVTGINVADGFYIAPGTGEPTTSDVLVAETVEDDGFSSQDRAGFMANYIWVDAGDYRIVEISEKAIVDSLGGTVETIDDSASGCGQSTYELVTVTSGGAPWAVASSGLYKVTFDQTTSEVVMVPIMSAGIIGSATEGGWGTDTPLAGSVTADGGSWSATEVILRSGEWKLRFNCRWNLDRRKDPAAGFGFDNGYQLFTNFGGTADNLATGNDQPNIPQTEDGKYTIVLDWTADDGFTMTVTRTGDAPVITFVPDEHQWALTGDATPNGWANDDPNDDPIGVDHDMNYEGYDAGSNTYTWEMASLAFVPGGFKFRANDKWDENMGWGGNLTLMGDISDFSDDGGNIKVGTAATYQIVLTTSDDGVTYTATFTEL